MKYVKITSLDEVKVGSKVYHSEDELVIRSIYGKNSMDIYNEKEDTLHTNFKIVDGIFKIKVNSLGGVEL